MIKMKNDHARTSTTYIIQIDSPRSHTDSEIHHNSVMNIEFKFHNKTARFEFNYNTYLTFFICLIETMITKYHNWKCQMKSYNLNRYTSLEI